MNSAPPTPGSRARDSKSVRSFKLAVRIVALVVATAGGGALLLFLPREPSTKAKSDSQQSAPARNEKDRSHSHSRNDAGATAKSSGAGFPPGRVTVSRLPEPTAYTRQLVN